MRLLPAAPPSALPDPPVTSDLCSVSAMRVLADMVDVQLCVVRARCLVEADPRQVCIIRLPLHLEASDRGKILPGGRLLCTKIFIQPCRHQEGLSRPLRRFLRLLIVRRRVRAASRWDELTSVAACAVLDIVLSKTQRKTPTQVHKGFKISRIRSLYVPHVPAAFA